MSLLEMGEEAVANAAVPGAGALLHIGRWFGRHWQTVVVGLVLAALAFLILKAPWAYADGKHSRDAEVAGLKKQYSDLQAADAKAQADAVQRALDKERARSNAREVSSDEIRTMGASADALAQRYIDRLRREAALAASRNAAQPATGAPGQSAGGIDGPGGLSVLDEADVRACTANTVKALGWPKFWDRMKALDQ
jgi:multidrug efflux pump subunit AcrA (membrane-fusion protein)